MKSKQTNDITIKRSDYVKISSLVPAATDDIQEFLELELDRASIVEDSEFPGDVVGMDSVVRYVTVESNQESEVRLVYPGTPASAVHHVSVLAPIGAALIGLRVGQSLKWPTPQGETREIRVLSVRQPEAV